METNLLVLLENRVSKLLKLKDIDIDYKDDDIFADFMSDIDGYDLEFYQKQLLYTYNFLLQTLAFNFEIEGFYIKDK